MRFPSGCVRFSGTTSKYSEKIGERSAVAEKKRSDNIRFIAP